MRLIYDIIADKRDGKTLSDEDIAYFLNKYLQGKIADYQMSSLLMAVCINGLTDHELHLWTEQMLNSGDIVSFHSIKKPVVDKHSTGGVGDKISIPLAPILGALGFAVPMISGRGLGHTGGTLDKLESIPGFNVNLNLEQFKKMVSDVDVSLIGQTPEIAPLDKKLYALRDVTGTVESIPLIASSIMSKKMAEGIDGLVLDVKVGSGAFMKNYAQAKRLAKTMKKIGENLGKKITILFTDMNEPLGYGVGHSLEIIESIEILKGTYIPQTSELISALASALLLTFSMAKNKAEAQNQIDEVIKTGSALSLFKKIITTQQGNASVVDDYSLLPLAGHTMEITAESSGFIKSIDAHAFGKSLVFLGGGRIQKTDNINHGVGFYFHKKRGDAVSNDEPIYRIYYDDEKKLKSAQHILKNSITISKDTVDSSPLILGSI